MLTQPGLTTPGHGEIFCHREFSFKSKHGSPHYASHIWIICVTAECLWILSCALTTMAPHSGDGSEWSVECGVSPPEAAEARGGRASPGPCDQSLLSPPSLLTITISHHRTPGGHGQDMVRTSDQHQQGNTQSSIIHSQHLRHARLMSRITGQGLLMTHHHLCPRPFPFFNVHFVGKRENTMIFEEKFF